MSVFALVVCVTLAGIFGGLRFVLPVEGKINRKDIFKDCAHLYVGGLFGAWAATFDVGYGILGIGLTILEVVAFVVRRNH